MNLVIRVDLRYVPWDMQLSAPYGDAEAATLIRMLEQGRKDGTLFHAFVTPAVAQTFPTIVEALLTERHPVDLLVLSRESLATDWEAGQQLARRLQHYFSGVAISSCSGAELHFDSGTLPSGCRFVSVPNGIEHGDRVFPVTLPSDDERPEDKPTDWVRRVVGRLEEMMDGGEGTAVLQVHPQVLGRIDPSLTKFRQIIGKAHELGFRQKTFGDLV